MSAQYREPATPAKVITRPRTMFTPRTTVPRPALATHNDNVPPPDSPSRLSPAPGAHTKLKIKSATTPEARARMLVKPKATPISKSKFQHVKEEEDDVWGAGHNVVAVLDAMEPAPKLDEKETVLVTVRASELKSGDGSSVWSTPDYDNRMIKCLKPRDHQQTQWSFDRILPPETDNARTYATSARAHVQSAMDGYNAVIFAYGQTASGKTFTLTGAPSNPGIIPLAIADMFAQIRSTPEREYLLRASYIELYNECIIDLLSSTGTKELTLSEGKKKGEVVINGLTELGVRTEEDVRELLRRGEEKRKVGTTDWNARSSRSHCVLRLVIESRVRSDNAYTPGRDKATRVSTLSIIDLAGSEKHTSSKERNAEGKHINQSLLTLKIVISKLADMAQKRTVMHVNYRDSKLTRLLQPSLSGDALISVICTISPAYINVGESSSTLGFAQGLKRVVLSAKRKDVHDPEALIQQYQNEIAELRALLRQKDSQPPSLSSKSDRARDAEMESRLTELKSLILNSSTVDEAAGQAHVMRPLSPTKVRYEELDYDKTSSKLQEELHLAELRNSELEDEVAQLKAELDVRPKDADARVVTLQQEVNQLRMIASDYERHLREPDRKVREDVEKEWRARYNQLENRLASKTTWAERLDENLRRTFADKAALELRCKEAEAKVLAVFEWVTNALDGDAGDDDDGYYDGDYDGDDAAARGEHDDFAAGMTADFGGPGTNMSRRRRGRGSSRDWQSEFQSFVGSLGARPPRNKLLRDEAVPALASVEDDDMF